jgi:hypothetical protein
MTTDNTQAQLGAKIGWLAGWLGSFSWVVALAIVFLLQGSTYFGLLGIGLFSLAMILAWYLTPWRYPHIRYWRLMLPLYLVLFLAIIWAIQGFGGWTASGLTLWQVWIMLPLCGPFVTIGWRRWCDQPTQANDQQSR